MKRADFVRAGASLLVASSPLAGWCADAAEPGYPTRAIRILVGFAPGGGIDAVARPVIQKMTTALGQPVILDNRPGAGGSIAAGLTAQAAPDGYTLLIIPPAFVINAALNTDLKFNSAEDFTGVAQMVQSPNVLVVNPNVPARTVPELIALAKSKRMSFGSSGVGTIGHLAGELFNLLAGTSILHVAYKGGGPVMTDLLGGQIDMVFASTGSIMPMIKSGKVRAIAVTTKTRSAELPDVPTLAEAGVAGYDATNWYGVIAPAHTPPAIVQRLSEEIRKAMVAIDVSSSVREQGLEPAPSSPAQFTAFVKTEITKWAKVVKAAGVKLE